MMQSIAPWTVRLLAVAMALLPGRPGAAAPLSPEACAAIEIEHAALAATGLPEIVKGGPDSRPETGAKAKEVARYIHLREQFLFRCGHDKKRATPAAVEGEGAGAAGAEKAAPAAPPPPKRKPARPAPAPAQAAKPATGAAAKAAKAGTTPAPAKPAQKPKPKPDDAYRPPPKEPVKSP
jgi:hypothetical protein